MERIIYCLRIMQSFFNAEAGGTYSERCALKNYNRLSSFTSTSFQIHH
jgi:hypothetical protein